MHTVLAFSMMASALEPSSVLQLTVMLASDSDEREQLPRGGHKWFPEVVFHICDNVHRTWKPHLRASKAAYPSAQEWPTERRTGWPRPDGRRDAGETVRCERTQAGVSLSDGAR
jgi:hypothetical protein